MAAAASSACVPAEAAKHVRTRSSRTVRAAVPFSPDVKLTSRRKKKKAANKEPTCCKKCGITLRGSTKHLCTACCEPSLDVGREEAQSNQEFEENKKKYLDEAKAFAANLAKVFDDLNAERLFCPVFKPKGPCACIQEYLSVAFAVNDRISSDKDFYITNCCAGDGSEQRVRSLLQLLQEAKKLSQQKCYDWEEVKRVGKSHAVGMGNGQKHSESFELFVNEHRPRLREMKLCERATQKVLFYSNNFLHRDLKTEPNANSASLCHQCRGLLQPERALLMKALTMCQHCILLVSGQEGSKNSGGIACPFKNVQKGRRIQRTKGKAALGKLRSLDQLAEDKCCQQRCTGLAQRYATLVSQWRERSQMGQTENRRVLAEMLTPSGPNSTNCYKFISWVTGCSFTTIAKVSKQMLATGGDREPPPHKLKKFWDAKNTSQEESIQNETL